MRVLGILLTLCLLAAQGCSTPPLAGPPAGRLPPGLQRTQWQRPRDLTRSPHSDYQADYCSATGGLVFVSDRQGGAELFRQEAGTPGEPRVIAPHPARERRPRLSPDGRRVAFVSTRADGGGDIWLMEAGGWFSQPALRKLTGIATADDQPCWHPDGDRLYFASAPSPLEPYRLWKLRLDGSSEALSPETGQMPDCSPDGRYLVFTVRTEDGGAGLRLLRLSDRQTAVLTDGPQLDLHPCWGPEGNRIFFARREFDSNGDGRLGRADVSSIFCVRFTESVFEESQERHPVRQLTSYASLDDFPRPMPDGFLFTRKSETGDADILSLGPSGQMPDLPTVGGFLRLARRADQRAEGPQLRLLAWRNVVWAAGAARREASITFGSARPDDVAEAWLALGRVLVQLDRADDAASAFRNVSEQFPSTVPAATAQLELLALERDALPEADQAQRRRHLRTASELEERLREELRGNRDESLRRLPARARLEQARALLALDEYAEAAALLESIPLDYPNQHEACARALLAEGEIYRVLDQPEAVREAYLGVVTKYGEQEKWAGQAARSVVNSVLRTEMRFNQKLSRLREMVENYGHLPILAARAQNAVGDLFHDRRDFLRAAEQYRHTLRRWPEERAAAAAALALASIHMERQEYDPAAELLREVWQEYAEPVGLPRERVAADLVTALLLKARREKRLEDPGLALDTYSSLARTGLNDPAAHRGIVECYHLLGRTEEAVSRYRNRREENPTDPLSRYGLALAYSYYGPQNWRVSNSARSERTRIDRRALELVEPAARDAPEVPYYHQLRGFLLSRLGAATQNDENLHAALKSYLTALGVADREWDPVNYPNLLFNVGEGYMLVEQPEAAFDYYRRALDAGFSLSEPGREAAVRKVGRGALAAGRYEWAAELLQRVLDDLEPADEPAALRRRAGVLDQLAFALYQHDRHGEAARTYRRYTQTVRQLIQVDTAGGAAYGRSLVRGHRNLAVNLYLNAQGETALEAQLREATNLLREALDQIEEVGAVRPGETGAGGLIGIDIQVALGEDGGAAEFDRDAEKRLLYSYLGRISALAGDYADAEKWMRRKLDLYPPLDPETERIGLLTEQAIVWSQIGSYRAAAGEATGAARAYREACRREARAGNLKGEAANALSFGRMVLRIEPAAADAALQKEAVRAHRPLLERLRGRETEHLVETRAALEANLSALLDVMEPSDKDAL